MASTPKLPRDFGGERGGGGHPIQMLSPTGTALRLSLGAASARVGPFKAGAVVSLWAEFDCAFRFGDSTVVAANDATSDPLTAKQREFYPLGSGNTHVAAILLSGAGPGIFHVRELL